MFTILAGLIGLAILVAGLATIVALTVSMGTNVARGYRARHCGRK